MKALWLVKRGTWEIRETPVPQPKPGEVRVAVRAFGLNFAELMASQGLYPDAPKLPAILGYELAGEIDAVGEGVDASRIRRARGRVHALRRATRSFAAFRRSSRSQFRWR